MKKSSRSLVAVGSFAVVLVGVKEARADEAEPAPSTQKVETAPAQVVPAEAHRGFGKDGSVVFDEILGIGIGGLASPGAPTVAGWLRYSDTKAEGGGFNGRTSTLALSPSLDVFIAPRLSLGARLTVFHVQSRMQYRTSATGGSLEPRIGWVMPITTDLAFWPRAFGSIGYSETTLEGLAQGAVGAVGGLANTTGAKGRTVAWGVGVEATMAATVSKTIALTFGPRIAYAKTDGKSGTLDIVSSSTSISASVHGGIAIVF